MPLHHTTSHNTTSYHIISHHILYHKYYITQHHTGLHHITLHHIHISHYITPHHTGLHLDYILSHYTTWTPSCITEPTPKKLKVSSVCQVTDIIHSLYLKKYGCPNYTQHVTRWRGKKQHM